MFLNATPHTITVINENDHGIEIPPSGVEVRLFPTSTPAPDVNSIPCVVNEFDETEIRDVAEQIARLLTNDYRFVAASIIPTERVKYVIVSSMVLNALKDTEISNRIVAPDTSPASAVRNADGQIIGVKRFQIAHQ